MATITIVDKRRAAICTEKLHLFVVSLRAHCKIVEEQLEQLTKISNRIATNTTKRKVLQK